MKFSIKLLLCCALGLLGFGALGADNVQNFDKWEKDISAFEQKDREHPPAKGGVLFIGSSTIRMWDSLARDFPEHHVINRGFGGSEIADATHFADRIVFPYKPRMIFLRAGGNDIHAGKSPEQVFSNFKDFVAKVRPRLPQVEIAYIALCPSIARWQHAEKEKVLNSLVEEYSRLTPGVKYIESYSLTLSPDGKPRPELFVQDKLHLNREGYKLLAERVRPFLPRVPGSKASSSNTSWQPVGFSGGGAMFTPAISPVDPNLMMLNCDMGAAYISEDGGRNWRMIHHAQLRSDTSCRPAFHPTNRDIIYASSGGQLRISRDRGRTFCPLGNLQAGLQGEIAIDPANPDVLLAGAHDGRCYLSQNGGAAWEACNGPAGKVIGFFFDHTRQGKRVFVATGKGIWRSDDGARTWNKATKGLPWEELQGFAGGANEKSGQLLLYCTVKSKEENGAFRGGIYRSRDGGETWEQSMGIGLNTETKTADEWAHGSISQYRQVLSTDAQPLTVYVMNTSTGFHPPHSDTVYRSDDGGETWRETYFMDPRFQRYNVAPDYVTASTGQSFKGGEAPFGAAICNQDPDRLILTRNECHVTHNGGTHWFCGSTYPAPGQKPGPGSAWTCNGLVMTTTWHYYVDPFETNRHYIAYTDIGWARSLDGGKSWIWWNQKTWAPWRNTCYGLAFDPETPGKIWGAFSDVHDIPNDNIILGRHGNRLPGGVCLSEDFGASWKAAGSGLPRMAVTSVVIAPRSEKNKRTLYAGVFEGGVYKSIDDGRTWTAKTNGLGDSANLRVSRVFLHPDNTLFAMVCAKRSGSDRSFLKEGVGLYRSRDGAESWEKVNVSKLLLYPKDFSVDPRNSKRILIGACDTSWEDREGGLYRTEDGGETWQRIGREGPQTFGGYFHPKRNDWLYMTLTESAPGAGLWLSKDNGRSWQPFDALPFSNIQRVEFGPADESKIYITTFGGSVWHGPAEPGANN